MTTVQHRQEEQQPSKCHGFRNCLESVCYGIGRKKPLSADRERVLKTNLLRCLSMGDLVAYGLASMLGGSVYVLTGAVMLKHTGPSVFVGYLVAGVVALLNALVYSELATRIPKSGSSYTYAYILLGELLGFLTGWSILLEYILGTCTVTRGWSSMLDGLTGNQISQWIIQNTGRLSNKDDILAEYADFVGAVFIIIMASIACCGIRGGAKMTGVFIFINVCALLIASIFMFVSTNPQNLQLPIPTSIMKTDPYSPDPGFLPFGVAGLVGGIAICFNAYIGFDAISTCAEETKSPSRDIPRANVLAVLTVTVVTMTASLSLAMYYPWYLVSADTPFLSVLRDNTQGGSESARTGMFYFVGCGCLIGLTSSVLSNLVAGPRIMYAIAEDGLLPICCAKVCKPFQTPVIATVFFTVIAVVLEMIFSIVSLADFLSLGTLIAYSMASIGLIMLRYCTPPEETVSMKPVALNEKSPSDNVVTQQQLDYILRTGKPGYLKPSASKCLSSSLVRAFNQGPPGNGPVALTAIYVCLNTLLIVLLKVGAAQGLWPVWRLVIAPVLLVFMIICICLIGSHVQHKPPHRELFRLPLVPFFPCATLSINMFLISELSWITWVRFFVWLVIGLLLYFFYGIWHSVVAKHDEATWQFQKLPDDNSSVVSQSPDYQAR